MPRFSAHIKDAHPEGFFALSVSPDYSTIATHLNRTDILPQIIYRMCGNAENFHVFQRLTFDALAFDSDKRASHQFWKLQFASQADKQDASLRHF